MFRLNYTHSLITSYMRTKEFEARHLLGVNPIVMQFDMKDTIFYEKGINSILVDLDYTSDKDWDYKVGYYVDCIFFKNAYALCDEFDDFETVFVDTNRGHLKYVDITIEIENLLIRLSEEDSEGICFDLKDTYTLESLEEFNKSFGTLGNESIKLQLKYLNISEKEYQMLEGLLKTNLLRGIDLELGYYSDKDKNYLNYYKEVHKRLKTLGFYDLREKELILPEKQITEIIGIAKNRYKLVGLEGLKLLCEMQKSVTRMYLK